MRMNDQDKFLEMDCLPFSSAFSESLFLSFLASSATFCCACGASFLFLPAITPVAPCFLFFFGTTSEFDL